MFIRRDIAMTEVSPPVRRLSRAKIALAVGVLVVVAIVGIVAVVWHRPAQKHTMS
jgi:hypothetical protein